MSFLRCFFGEGGSVLIMGILWFFCFGLLNGFDFGIFLMGVSCFFWLFCNMQVYL